MGSTDPGLYVFNDTKSIDKCQFFSLRHLLGKPYCNIKGLFQGRQVLGDGIEEVVQYQFSSDIHPSLNLMIASISKQINNFHIAFGHSTNLRMAYWSTTKS